MNTHVGTTPSQLGLSSSLALIDSDSLETPYLSATDTLRMITDVVSPSAKLNIIGTYITLCVLASGHGCVAWWWNVGLWPANFSCPRLDLQLIGGHYCG